MVDKGYREFHPGAVIRAGAGARMGRSLLPLAAEASAAVLRRVSGRTPRPARAGAPELVPDFGAASRTPGMAGGTLVNVAPLRVLGTGGELNPASSYRFEYVTGDSHGNMTTATGGVCFSKTPWTGGPRPVIVLAPSTQGVAAHCDPSHTCAIGLNVYYSPPLDAIAAYELPVFTWFLANGADVVFIDYPRDPVLGIQSYCDSISAAHSLFDALRAARELGVAADSPVGLWGFSQGGGAVGWAAQLAEGHPDISPRAAVVGAPPSELGEVLREVDGGLLTGVIAYAVAGLSVSRPELHDEIMPKLTAEGLRIILRNVATCAGGTLLASGYRDTARWTVSGHRLHDILDDLPEVSAEFRRQRLGGIAPGMPVLLWGSRHDDVIPVAQVRRVRDAWSLAGTDLSYHESRAPKVPGRTGVNHFGPYFRHLRTYSGWLLDQLH
ncbi:lipase family protein [Corynebacterium pacaense]|uniref:lipase family protein n=1 Tax=Corynebacterium pacaense TaxID=1816684 RepID=UPI0009B9AD32|nr:lipase family protein [Corynebacterium pacaense]